jgi:hypothetical protein
MPEYYLDPLKPKLVYILAYLIRILSNKDKQDRRWLVYCPSKNSVFCFVCRLLSSLSVALVSHGCNDWKNLYSRLKSHENSSDHIQCVLKWLEAEKRLKCGKTIDAAIQNQIQQENQCWHEILERFLAIIQQLASHNMAFRGRRDGLEQQKSGNFLDQFKFTAKFDPILRKIIVFIIII